MKSIYLIKVTLIGHFILREAVVKRTGPGTMLGTNLLERYLLDINYVRITPIALVLPLLSLIWTILKALELVFLLLPLLPHPGSNDYM